jgi:hypothetical protein
MPVFSPLPLILSQDCFVVAKNMPEGGRGNRNGWIYRPSGSVSSLKNTFKKKIG